MLAVKPGWNFYDRGITESLPRGLCFIGDPHLSTAQHKYCLDILSRAVRIASHSRLVPVILGNMFRSPREATPALFSGLFRIFRKSLYRPIANLGSRDKHGAHLTPDCALWVLAESGAVSVMRNTRTQALLIALEDGPIALYTVPHGQDVPHTIESLCAPERTVVVTHKDLDCGEVCLGTKAIHEIRGASSLVNEHGRDIQGQRIPGATVCVNPGNILRRADAIRAHEPAVWSWRPGQRVPERHLLHLLPATPVFELTAISDDQLATGMAEDGAFDDGRETRPLYELEQETLQEAGRPSP